MPYGRSAKKKELNNKISCQDSLTGYFFVEFRVEMMYNNSVLQKKKEVKR